MSGMNVPREPVAVFVGEGDRVNAVARAAEVIQRRFGGREASGLLEAQCITGTTIVFIAARATEFINHVGKQPGWARLRPHVRGETEGLRSRRI